MTSRDVDQFDLPRRREHPQFAGRQLDARYTTFDSLSRERSIVRGSGTAVKMERLLALGIQRLAERRRPSFHILKQGNVLEDIKHAGETC